MTPHEFLIKVAPLQRAEHTVRALMPERRIRRLLKLEADEACLLIMRRTFSRGRVASVADLYHPGSRYELAANFPAEVTAMSDTNTRMPLRAPRGTQLSCKSWLTEAPLRMLMNNLDPEVAERPAELVVYGGIGKAARNWQCLRADRDRAAAAGR